MRDTFSESTSQMHNAIVALNIISKGFWLLFIFIFLPTFGFPFLLDVLTILTSP